MSETVNNKMILSNIASYLTVNSQEMYVQELLQVFNIIHYKNITRYVYLYMHIIRLL